MKYGRVAPWIFLLPTIVGLGLFRVGPIIAAFLVSFTRWNVISAPRWLGLANYSELINSEVFWRVLKNTAVFSLTYVPGVMICGLFLAILVNNKLRGITFFRGLYYLPVITSTVAIGVVWSWILSPRFGILTRFPPRSRSSQCPFVPRRLALCTPDPGRGLCVENGGLPHDSFPRGTAEYSSRLL